jgi:hypothetical protein
MAAQWGSASLAPGASQGWFFARPNTPNFLPVLQVIPLTPSFTSNLWYVAGDGYPYLNQLGVSAVWSQLSGDLTSLVYFMVVRNNSNNVVEYAFLEADGYGSPAAAPPGGGLESSSNYFLYGGTNPDGSNIPLRDIVVTIDVTEPLVGSPPFSFQLNAWSPQGDLDAWQQYGISLAPGSNQVNSFAENWPTAGNNLFNIEPAGFVSLPNETTIPAGYKIVITLTYANGNSGDIGGSIVTVYDGAGTMLGSQTITIIGQPLAGGGTATVADLSPILAYQLNLVGWANGQVSALSSGAGTITYSSSTPMVALSGPPADAEGFFTAETANSIYGPLTSDSNTTFVQSFSTTSTRAMRARQGGHVRQSRFAPR